MGVALLLVATGGLVACSNHSDAASPPAPTTTVQPPTTAAAFACPVTRRQVEDLYARIDFLDSTSTKTSCIFERFDGNGSLAVVLATGGATAYKDAVADLVAPEAVEGIGDEALYSETRTTLVARSGDRVLTLQNHSLDGFDGAADAAAQDVARRTASVALAKVVFAG